MSFLKFQNRDGEGSEVIRAAAEFSGRLDNGYSSWCSELHHDFLVS
jgi:hypothetical protein